MDIKDLVQENDAIRGWVTYMDGFDIEIEHVGKQRLQEITRRCTKTYWRNHNQVEELDAKRLTREVARFICDWRLPGEIFAKIFPVKSGLDLAGVRIDCTEENKIYMLERAYGFDDFIMRTITDIEALRAEQIEKELKNSEALSQAG